MSEPPSATASLTEIAREWGRIGCVGFGGPPAHMTLLRELCVQDRRWIDEEAFERAVAATSLLPGPASTQLAIYCAWRLRRRVGALVGGACFIVPGLVLILALSALFLATSPPAWARGAGAAAGAVVAGVAVRTGLDLGRPIWARAAPGRRPRLTAYAVAAAVATATLGPWLVLVLLGCGAVELAVEAPPGRRGRQHVLAWPPLPLAFVGTGGIGALMWTAFKVGALSFGGGLVIIPLMQSDAVRGHHWMTGAQFLNAVVLGQITPGPVVHTVAAVGYAAGGVGAALLATLIAFSPSFAFVLGGAERFDRLLGDTRVRAFLTGAVPAAAGAIVGAAVPLTQALSETWQYGVLALGGLGLLVWRLGVVEVLVAIGTAGALGGALGAPLPH